MTEVKILKPMWIDGEIADPDTVVNVSESEAAYLVGIGRVERIEAIDAVSVGADAQDSAEADSVDVDEVAGESDIVTK